VNTAATISSAELAAARCDRCHEHPGAKFLDGYWTCRICARQYLEALEVERRQICLRNWPYPMRRV